jgi:hypothetical protein
VNVGFYHLCSAIERFDLVTGCSSRYERRTLDDDENDDDVVAK